MEPWGLRWRSKTSFILATVGLGLFTDIFLYSLVLPILPYLLEDRLHVSTEQLQRYSSGLLAAHTGSAVFFCPITGVLVDKFARRKTPYIVGVLVLLLATVLFFLGNSVSILFGARILQGISGALIWTVGQALLIDTVGAEHAGKATGSIYGLVSVGTLFAPVLGGILYQTTGIIGPLALCCFLLCIDLLMRILVVEKKAAFEAVNGDRDHLQGHQEAEDSFRSDSANPLLEPPKDPAYVISPNQSWIIELCPVLFCFKKIRMITASWITLVHATLLGTLDATVPLIGEQFYNFNSLQTGLLLLPILIPILLFGPVAGWLMDRKGSRFLVILGFGLLVPILASLRMAQPGGISAVLVYCILLALCGSCLAFTSPPALVESTVVVDKYFKANPNMFGPNGPYAQISGISGMLYNAGTALGALLAGGLKESIGYGNINLALAALAFVTALLGTVFQHEA